MKISNIVKILVAGAAALLLSSCKFSLVNDVHPYKEISIEAFSIEGQVSARIDRSNRKCIVVMPDTDASGNPTNLSNLKVTSFKLSDNADSVTPDIKVGSTLNLSKEFDVIIKLYDFTFNWQIIAMKQSEMNE